MAKLAFELRTVPKAGALAVIKHIAYDCKMDF